MKCFCIYCHHEIIKHFEDVIPIFNNCQDEITSIIALRCR